MGGIENLAADSDDPWAKATRRSQGLVDKGLGQAVTAYYARYLPLGLFLLVVAVALVAFFTSRGTEGDWPLYLIIGCGLAVVAVLTGGLIYNSKHVVPAAEYGNVDVLLSLESEERKQIRQQIAGKIPAEREHLAVARGAAVQMRKGLATQLLFAPIYPLVFLPQALRLAMRGDDLFAWFMFIAVGLLTIGIAFIVRDFRRAGRFLTRTTGQPLPTKTDEHRA
jgi:hypothetical protein